ncbi:sugar kinase [Dolosicoccus paucivorans]|uniref:Sugar kinase n=1 Tax=Dolosicoccus paucivorans TaxID=84521 RepID=A0A2N6SLE8_9LACT|nr:sugar kinase [Dolosicoccus paucivorans]PMC57901.1 sugar kinase [Dolosicoccus paucivorans]
MKKILCLGEALFRLTTPTGSKIENFGDLKLLVGGAELNVAVNLAQFGLPTAFATKIPNNELGKIVTRTLAQYGVEHSRVILGTEMERLGTYYVEPGASMRAGNVVYDRAYSSMSLMSEVEWDLDTLLADVDILHITGITAAISDKWREHIVEIIECAHQKGIKVSFDMNFRSKLWTSLEAKKTYQQILPYVNYLSANILDAIHFMDIYLDENADLEKYIKSIADKYSNLEYIYGTIRHSVTPNQYDYKGFLYDARTTVMVKSSEYQIRDVIDRIGAGDSYTAGVLAGIAQNSSDQEIVDFATASSVLNHSYLSDYNLFNANEVHSFMKNSGNIVR